MSTIIKILFSGILSAGFTFLSILLVRFNIPMEGQEQFLKLTNFSLIVLPVFELGCSTVIPTRNFKCKNTFIFFLSFASLLYVCLLQFVESGELYFEIITIAYLVGITKLISSLLLSDELWFQYNLVSVLMPMMRFLGVLIYVFSSSDLSIGSILIVASITALIAAVYVALKTGSFSFISGRVVDKSIILQHFITSLIIALAMRVDQLIVDKFYGPEVFINYSMIFQVTMILPMITNSVFTYFLPSKLAVSASRDLSLLVIVSTLGLIPFLFGLFAYLAPLILNIHDEAIFLCGALISSAALGGIYFGRLEANLYRDDASGIVRLKLIQLTVISTSIGFVYYGFPVYTVAILIYLSRLIAWLLLVKRYV